MLNAKLSSQVLGGCLQNTKKCMYGNYKGFYLTIEPSDSQYIIKINASSSDDPDNTQLNSFLRNQKNSVKQIADVQTESYYLVITFRTPNLAKNVPNTINGIVEPIIQYLINGAYVSGCENCGSAMESLNCYEINQGYHYLCETCTNEIQNALQENQQVTQSQKSHFFPGLIGAFLGSLIGCVLWIIIYKLGYIAGIAGAVTGICALKGYEIFGKHLDKKGVIGSVIIMFTSIYLANKLAWTWEAYDALIYYSFSDIFKSLNDIIAESGLTADFYKDLIIGYALTILCTYKNIINAFKVSTGSYTITQM